MKMGRIVEEQALFEQLTLSDFKKWSFAALKAFNNYPKIWTTIVTTYEYHEWVLPSLLLIYELIQQAALVNFMLFLNIFKISKILF